MTPIIGWPQTEEMSSTKEPSPLLSRLKFRVVQPVDIPRCHQLECLAYPEDVAASKQTLQHRQHHAAPFFRCVLLKKPKQGKQSADHDVLQVKEHVLQVKEPDLLGDRPGRKKSDDEACHHVHHSPSNELIGYICATRCHDVKPTSELLNGSTNNDNLGGEITPDSNVEDKWQPYPYETKHEPNGRYLAIHSIVVQKDYQRSGVAKALLEYYIKSISLYNAELDEAGINRRRNRIQAKKPDSRIDKIVVLSYSSMANLFVSSGFRWKATLRGGLDPLFELERDVESSPSPPHSADFPDVHIHPLMEKPCFIVDAFANHTSCGSSGNPAAIVVLTQDPTKLISDYYNSVDTEQSGTVQYNNEASSTMNEIILAAKEVQEDDQLAEIRAETWMKSVAKEFNQPATAFVWPIYVEEGVAKWGRQSQKDSISISDDELGLSYHEESSSDSETHNESHYAIRYYTGSGTEVERGAHANLAAASVLFRWFSTDSVEGEKKVISFHSRKDEVLRSTLISPLPDEHLSSTLMEQSTAPCTQSNSIQISIDFPWRIVDPMPPGPEGQGAVLAMMRRSFFKAWSVAEDDEKEDLETDELAFSLSSDHVTYVGVTNDGEDLFIELSVDGFNMISGRTVDYDALRAGLNGKGVIICCEVPETVNARSTSEDSLESNTEKGGVSGDDTTIDFCSRYFQPYLSSEDPVSGWPHCALGPYFSARLGKDKVVGLQSSDRGGLVECIMKSSEQKVCIVGSAVTTIAGKTLMRA